MYINMYHTRNRNVKVYEVIWMLVATWENK